MKRLAGVLTIIVVLAGLVAPAHGGGFDLEGEREKLRSWLADRHAEIGDEYKKAEIYTQARRQYDRARELDPENRKAWRGMGYRKRGGEWVADDPIPEENGVHGNELIEAQEKPDAKKQENWKRCADRCRRIIDKAAKDGDERAARILAIELLYYEPEDAEARKMRGHVKHEDAWRPSFAKAWREEGSKIHGDESFGEEVEGEDETAKTIGTTFRVRDSEWLITRTSYDVTRAKMLHRAALAAARRAQGLLGVEGPPFGGHRYTITLLQSKTEYDDMLTKVLKLEGDTLEFAKRLSGRGHSDPYGYMCWSRSDDGGNDMLCNTVSLRVLAHAQEGGGNRAPWVTTGFSYFVTSHVLNTTMTRRYTMEKAGATSSDHEVIPEFTKKSGSPELLREVALYNIAFDRDIPLRDLVATGINDMQQAHAAKAFSFMEFAFNRHKEQARKWLKGGGHKEAKPRVEALEAAFEKPLEDLETEWREWVLLNY